jgi:hypothetical protein
MFFRTLCLTVASAWLLAACASTPLGDGIQGWHEVRLPGKPPTQYSPAHKDGRDATAAVSERSASVWRRRVSAAPAVPGEVSFSWWVQDLVAGANVAEQGLTDAPARVLFAFDGDVARLPLRTRAQFELAEALTGERPPYATLVYVWDAALPVGSIVVNPRSDRVRKIVVDSGPTQLRRWRDHRRNLAADFRRAFGEEPGTLSSVGLMTDSDNTGSRALSWYGPIELH